MTAPVREEGLLDAPVERVWALLANPARYPEWAADSIETTGVPTKIEKGSSFRQTSPGPFGRTDTTTFVVEELEDLHEIKLRCQKSGYYSRWRLTEARGGTFAVLELGVEPIGLIGRFAKVAVTRSQLRKVSHESIEGLRRTAGT